MRVHNAQLRMMLLLGKHQQANALDSEVGSAEQFWAAQTSGAVAACSLTA